ncbi:hypothetical protein GT755_30530 [Herbidospora sp. NEAU-GS84]|uniref:Uncharacterized protein n=1 Tax=Herbidospora solisilvae TaxID=2696284 RepID=A0A7C9J6H7_9ACTN|nr:nitroreductase family protein [Herbidospora solisilvae]NAS26002.1 hypothetical protein [Herbidospora solisilvae]
MDVDCCGLTFPEGEDVPDQRGDGLEAVVEAARWAPSIHNSQPWSFAIDGEEICLRCAWAAVDDQLRCGTVQRAAFHTQLLEYPLLREFVRTELCSGEYPQIILRLGYCVSTPQVFRRPLVEVLS